MKVESKFKLGGVSLMLIMALILLTCGVELCKDYQIMRLK